MTPIRSRDLTDKLNFGKRFVNRTCSNGGVFPCSHPCWRSTSASCIKPSNVPRIARFLSAKPSSHARLFGGCSVPSDGFYMFLHASRVRRMIMRTTSSDVLFKLADSTAEQQVAAIQPPPSDNSRWWKQVVKKKIPKNWWVLFTCLDVCSQKNWEVHFYIPINDLPRSTALAHLQSETTTCESINEAGYPSLFGRLKTLFLDFEVLVNPHVDLKMGMNGWRSVFSSF